MSPERRERFIDAALRCASAIGPWFYWMGFPMAGMRRRDPRC